MDGMLEIAREQVENGAHGLRHQCGSNRESDEAQTMQNW